MLISCMSFYLLKFYYSCILFSEGTAGGGNMFPGVVAGKTMQMNT